jgi:hypothetical protein
MLDAPRHIIGGFGGGGVDRGVGGWCPLFAALAPVLMQTMISVWKLSRVVRATHQLFFPGYGQEVGGGGGGTYMYDGSSPRHLKRYFLKKL